MGTNWTEKRMKNREGSTSLWDMRSEKVEGALMQSLAQNRQITSPLATRLLVWVSLFSIFSDKEG
jgi:hypothetical protein